MKIPEHIAIIPDGNRRWAKNKKILLFMGHKKGAEITEKILKTAFDYGVEFLTFWGCSVDNIKKRPKTEIIFLFKLFDEYFIKLAADREIHDKKIKINVIGKWEELFPEKVKKSIKNAIEATKNYKKHQLTVLLAYGGMDEMEEAIQNIAKLKNRNSNLKINKEIVKNNLWTKNLPPVDLVIRTGGEPHWSSGFMMWDTANSQLFFTDVLWPDFTVNELKSAFLYYGKTARRIGK
ncbi:MAG: polyprenyl diphosphate synthase [Patescibacteria group bacterium]|nr:polyprenyl diphosphate synthase [Patescibacteria group bacterium]